MLPEETDVLPLREFSAARQKERNILTLFNQESTCCAYDVGLRVVRIRMSVAPVCREGYLGYLDEAQMSKRREGSLEYCWKGLASLLDTTIHIGLEN